MKLLAALICVALVPVAAVAGFVLHHPATRVVAKDRPVDAKVTAAWEPVRVANLFGKMPAENLIQGQVGGQTYRCATILGHDKVWVVQFCAEIDGGAA